MHDYGGQNSCYFTSSPNNQFFHIHNKIDERFIRRNDNGHSKRRGIQMYFDDVSRNAKFTTGLSSSWSYYGNDDRHIRPKEEDTASQRYAREKMEALNQIFKKYDEESASQLSPEEVFSITNNWIHQSKEIESRFLNKNNIVESEEEEEEMFMSDSKLLTGCIADFWKTLVQEMKVHEAKIKLDPSSFKNSDYTMMLIYPHCADLYNYSTFSWMKTAIQYSSQCYPCVLGQKLQINLFHPQFKNQPDIFGGFSRSHSPFPTLRLHFSAASDKDDNLPYIGKWYSSMDTLTRNSIEDLFNSPAATKTTSFDVENSSSYEENANSSNGKHRNDQALIKIFQEWAGTINGHHGPNHLKFHDKNEPIQTSYQMLQYDDKTPFLVSRADIPEMAYADIWTFITQSIDQLKPDISATATNLKSSNGDYSRSTSSFMIFTNFTNFNACDFKKFALSVNAALKQMNFDGLNISMEIFHPEYVGKKESHNKMRRSPYPTIQIIYSSD